ncbi:MAG: MFS transporter [Bacteroidales bacterium]
MRINTGTGTIPISILLGIWSISALNALPGLAVSPILGKLSLIFPHSTELEIQMLTSLPSLLIIPFILFSGQLSSKFNKIKLLQGGLIIFALSGLLYLFASSMWELIVISALLGIGSGIIVPLSTGLISSYFSGTYRTKQMGISSGVTNITLVLVTFLTGWLAQYNWHAPFVVYLLPIISLFLIYNMSKGKEYAQGESQHKEVSAQQDKESPIQGKYGFNINQLVQLMLFYGVVTYLALTVLFNLPFLIKSYGLGSENAGTIISLFFLAIMAPGFLLNTILRKLREKTKLISLCSIALGLGLILLTHNEWIMIAGSILIGLGYGVIQPLIYDETVRTAIPSKITFALAFVMAMNYVAILVSPFIISFFKNIIDAKASDQFAFIFNFCATLLLIGYALWRPKQFAFKVNTDIPEKV